MDGLADGRNKMGETINLDLGLVKMAPLQMARIIFYNLITIPGDFVARKVIRHKLQGMDKRNDGI